MLYLIGIGLKPGHLTEEAREKLKECDAFYLDAYTSTYGEGNIEELEKEIGHKIFRLQRKQVEEQSDEIITTAKKNDVAFLVYGNVFSATTHIQLVLDAKKEGVKTSFIPGISIFSFLGNLGLDEYRFGRVCTIAYPEENYSPESFMNTVLENRKSGLHTLCLLDIKSEDNRMMNSGEAVEILQNIAKKRKEDQLENAVVIAVGAAGSEGQKIKVRKWKGEEKLNLGVFPQILVVCGKLTDKEKEALEVLEGWKDE